MIEPAQRIAMVVGATGLVGGSLLKELREGTEFTRVYIITRRPLAVEHPRIANRIVNFDQLEAQLRGMACTDAFCCLGTTMARAGSEAEFRRVDLEYVMAFARAARAAGVQRFVVVSSARADPGARHLYLRVKGEMEQALAGLGFSALHILQPGLLLGLRRDVRPLELLATAGMPAVNPLLFGKRRAYRGVPARTVARAMLGAARSQRRGVQRYTYDGILTLAGRAP